MKTRLFTPLMIVFLMAALMTACVLPGAAGQEPTPDTQATAETMLQQTQMADVVQQATVDTAVDAAVQATITALGPTPTPGPTVEYVTMSEEELAALIDEAVAEATTATQAAYTATSSTTTDDYVTTEEIYYVSPYVYYADDAIYYAEELIDYYFEMYGEYASETIDLLYEIEEDLESMATSMDEIATIMEAGAETASAAIEELNAALSEAQTRANEAQQMHTQISQQIQAELDARVSEALNVQPDLVAPDLPGTIQQLYQFAGGVRQGFSNDGRISPDELTRISQLSANAIASLKQYGGPALQGLSGEMQKITTQIARGQWQQAQHSLGGFEKQMPELPSGFNMPDMPELPGIPSRPGRGN